MFLDKYLDEAIERVTWDNPQYKEIILLRCKLEMRTMFVRVLTAITTSLLVGAAIQIMRVIGIF